MMLQHSFYVSVTFRSALKNVTEESLVAQEIMLVVIFLLFDPTSRLLLESKFIVYLQL